MFLVDTVGIVQWKLGKRNESVTFCCSLSLTKWGAIASGIVGATVIVSGINDALTPADVTAGTVADEIGNADTLGLYCGRVSDLPLQASIDPVIPANAGGSAAAGRFETGLIFPEFGRDWAS